MTPDPEKLIDELATCIKPQGKYYDEPWALDRTRTREIIAPLVVDKERLDWLDNAQGSVVRDNKYFPVCGHAKTQAWKTGECVRAAIDAARLENNK